MTEGRPGAERRFPGFVPVEPGNQIGVAPTHRLSDLRGMRVFVADSLVGHVSDLILDPVEQLVLGFDVEATSGKHYFLPLALTLIPDEHISVTSPLHMVDDVEYYRLRGRRPDWAAMAQLRLELVSGAILDPATAV